MQPLFGSSCKSFFHRHSIFTDILFSQKIVEHTSENKKLQRSDGSQLKGAGEGGWGMTKCMVCTLTLNTERSYIMRKISGMHDTE